MAHRIDGYVEARRDDLIALLARLVAARTENPPGNEHLAADVVARWFEDHDISFKTFEKEPGRTNIIGTMGSGQPRVLIAGHLDTVPAGDGWATDPFEAVVKDGCVYGRGTCDNKGATASLLLAGAFLKSIEDELHGEMWLAGVADEELGSALGLEYLISEGVLDVDFALVPDVPEGLQLIDIAEKGALFCEITSCGRQAHGSRPQDGVNAIWNLIDALNRLRRAAPPFKAHPHLTPPTLNLGTIEGGAAPNMVPATARAVVDIRYLPGTTEADVLAHIRRALDETARENGGTFEMRLINALPPTEMCEDSPLVAAMVAASNDVLDQPVRIGGLAGATVTKQLLAAGIPVIGGGPGEEGQAHVANERVPIQQLVDLTRILARACLRIFGKGSCRRRQK